MAAVATTVPHAYSLIEVLPRAGTLGAEIKGVDLSTSMNDTLFAEIEQGDV